MNWGAGGNNSTRTRITNNIEAGKEKKNHTTYKVHGNYLESFTSGKPYLPPFFPTDSLHVYL